MADDAYSPEVIDLMSAAFDAAYDQLEGEPSQALQLQLARRIMAAVKAGEQDLARLTGIALGEIVMEVLPRTMRRHQYSPNRPLSCLTGLDHQACRLLAMP